VRILFLCHRIPYPPNKGEKIRSFHQLRALAARHEVDVFTLADDPDDLLHREALAAHCRELTVARIFPKLARLRSLPYLLTRTPLTIPYFHSATLRTQIRKAIEQRRYDRIFVYCSAMAQYVDWKAVAPNIPVILDIVDVDSNKWAQYAAARRFPFSAVFRKEARDLREYERKVCEASTCVLVSTDREAQLTREIAPGARVHVVRIGMDVHRFEPRSVDASMAPTIIFTGDMAYFPNQEAATFFARDVLPLVRRDLPNARFLIVGRRPHRRIEDLRQLGQIEVTGSVPDVRPWLAQASVAVAPLRIAAGIQTKILEAMAAGLPVVATSRAVQGLTSSVAEMIRTGDTADRLAAHVVELLRDREAAYRRGLEGRKRIAAEYSWETSLQSLLRIVEHPSESEDSGRIGDGVERHVAFTHASAVQG
jgi:polysaccharide biosynthesis protein PslH